MIRKRALVHWEKENVCAHGEFRAQLLISTIKIMFVIKVTELHKIKGESRAQLASRNSLTDLLWEGLDSGMSSRLSSAKIRRQN